MSCNLDLWTAGVCQTNLHDSLSPVIKQTPSMAATIAQSVLINTYYTHYFTIISIICIIIHIISNLAIQIWVHIHCRKLANRHIHNWGSVSKQTTYPYRIFPRFYRFFPRNLPFFSANTLMYLEFSKAFPIRGFEPRTEKYPILETFLFF